MCGSKLHKVKDCPRKDTEPIAEGPAVKGLNKKELKVALTAPLPQAATSQSSAQPSLQQAAVNVERMTPAAKAAADPPLLPPSNDALRDVLAETNRVLKALTTSSGGSTTATSSAQGAVQDPLAQAASEGRTQGVRGSCGSPGFRSQPCLPRSTG